MNVIVDLINASSDVKVPSSDDFQRWSYAAMEELSKAEAENIFEISIRLVDDEESAELNQQYRQKTGSTNILSFPLGDIQIEEQLSFLGDLAICAPVVKREAEEQNKTLREHWAHMTIHGVLHLNAYDHETDTEAEEMENLEVHILKTLGFNNPYHYTIQP